MYDLRELLLSVGVLQQERDSIYLKNKQSAPTFIHEDKKYGSESLSFRRSIIWNQLPDQQKSCKN